MTEDADRIEQWQRLALEQTRIAQKWSMRALGAEADLAAWQQEKRLGWLHHVGVGEDSTLHVWPKGEAHLTEPADPYCPCLPELYETTGGIVISVHREGIMP